MDPVPTSVLNLEQLPDDAIVMVLQYLPVADVLDCRLVSKRLSGLALHWDVWRHRSLKDDDEYAGAVLHLAPCLNKLKVTGHVPTLAVTTTRCAVASLELYADDDGMTINIAEYALAVRNQEFLGRLRKLKLDIDIRSESDVLVRTVAMCSNLDSLQIVGYLPDATHHVVHGPPRPSLTSFRCAVQEESLSFVRTILAGHAPTLEQVNLSARHDFEVEVTTTAELFVTMPRLRSLRFDKSFCGMNVVAECKTLRDVSIFVDSTPDNIDKLSDFLRRANQLRRVHLDCIQVDEDFPEVGAALIKALVSSGRSHLERLALDGLVGVRPLLRALPSLPALRHLNLSCAEPDDELLKSITPVTAPALRLLEIGVDQGQCPHAWIHGAAVKATLAENPSLHIQLWCLRSVKCQDCDTCVLSCHQEVKWGTLGKIGLYSHDPAKCPSPEEHSDDIDWERSYDRFYNVACTWIHT